MIYEHTLKEIFVEVPV